jgi:hypothetical protein
VWCSCEVQVKVAAYRDFVAPALPLKHRLPSPLPQIRPAPEHFASLWSSHDHQSVRSTERSSFAPIVRYASREERRHHSSGRRQDGRLQRHGRGPRSATMTFAFDPPIASPTISTLRGLASSRHPASGPRMRERGQPDGSRPDGHVPARRRTVGCSAARSAAISIGIARPRRRVDRPIDHLRIYP